jgi:hypothetical protein
MRNALQLAPAYLVQEAPTALRGQSLTFRPRQVMKFPGGDPPRHRKFIRITNEDTNTRLYLVAGDEQSVDPSTLTVKLSTIDTDGRPFSVVELWTNATIYLKNVNATETVTPVQILELFYV